MTSLRETIENFHAYVLGQDDAITQEIVGSDQGFKETRLGVYQIGYFLRLFEALSKDFPIVKKLAGEEVFEQLVYDYLCDYPSTYFSLRYVGQHFAQFLSDLPSSSADPVWAEMATFEWSLVNVIDAKDAPQLTFEEMAAIKPESWGDLRLVTHPSVEIYPFFYEVPRLWQDLVQNGEKSVKQREKKPTYWLIWRFNRQTYFAPINENQFWMIRAIQAGSTFSEVCAGLCEHLGEDKVVPFVAETLRTWITEGIFSEYTACT